jgi:hypothetical protein
MASLVYVHLILRSTYLIIQNLKYTEVNNGI